VVDSVRAHNKFYLEQLQVKDSMRKNRDAAKKMVLKNLNGKFELGAKIYSSSRNNTKSEGLKTTRREVSDFNTRCGDKQEEFMDYFDRRNTSPTI
jgi:hypothetical protein